MKNFGRILLIVAICALVSLACQAILGPIQSPTPTAQAPQTPTRAPLSTEIPTAIPPAPVQPGTTNPDEPVFISGEIPYTSPFFLNSISEPFVLLEDQAGFVNRDLEFEFPLEGQTIGAVALQEDNSLTYSLALPAIPQGTFVDVDNDGEEDRGVQVFAIAYWSNTWGDPFLEERDGTGWSTAYASTITDPERDDEISGGILLVWAPDDQQAFPTGFGEDNQLFTEDDPTEPIPAGYNLVDLDQEPFRFYKQAHAEIELNEGEVAVNDYSEMSFQEAFEALFDKVSREYPFTREKDIDWPVLYEEFSPQIATARNPKDFYRIMRDFSQAIPDAHIGLSFNAEVFFEEQGGSFGLVLKELSDSRVIAIQILPDTPAEQAGIEVRAEIITWDGEPVSDAVDNVEPYLGPYSTGHHKRLQQTVFLTRVPPETEITLTYKNPDETREEEVTLEAIIEYDSMFAALADFNFDEMVLPVEGEVLDESGLGYIQVTTFSDDYRIIAYLWDRFMHGLVNNEVPGLIIDLRVNSGGSAGLARDFAGYFFDEELVLSRDAYFNDLTEKFEYRDLPTRIKPAPFQYEGPIAVLVGPDCISACEGFAYALTQGGRATIVGHYPTAGAFGEVGRGQYQLPGDLSMQFPTGRSETPDGEVLIEGKGVEPDIVVPVTEESALGREDTVLQAAVQAVLEEIQ